jgi:hypothetical protein
MSDWNALGRIRALHDKLWAVGPALANASHDVSKLSLIGREKLGNICTALGQTI